MVIGKIQRALSAFLTSLCRILRKHLGGFSWSEKHEQLLSGQSALLRHQIAAKWDQIHRLEEMRATLASLKCELCAHEGDRSSFKEFRTQCMFGGGEILRHQCPECDVIFGSEVMLRLSPQALSQEYEWHYLAFSEGDSTEDELRAFRALQPNRAGRYLNWGAGSWSRSLSILRSEGWDVLGFEPHSSAAPREGVVTSLEHIRHLSFDGIFSNNLLEHLRYPVEDLRQMASLLMPDALMSHATPCFDYRFEFTRFHLFFFLGRARSLLAEKSGLREVSFEEDGNFMNWVVRKP